MNEEKKYTGPTELEPIYMIEYSGPRTPEAIRAFREEAARAWEREHPDKYCVGHGGQVRVDGAKNKPILFMLIESARWEDLEASGFKRP